MIKISVISATWNRADLLDCALYSYAQQTMPKDEWEYLICDDMSDDWTQGCVQKWIDQGLPIRYFTSEELGHPKEPGKWRDGCILRNALSTHARGEVLVSTHPEILISPTALEDAYASVDKDREAWHTAIPYWLPKTADLQKLKAWKSDLTKLTRLKGFYDPSWPDPIHSPGAPDYRNQNQEQRLDWESEVWWAMDMGKWRWMGGFKHFTKWGSIDMDFMNRRRRIGIRTIPIMSEDTPHKKGVLMVYHQWHESARDMDAALKELRDTHSSYSSADDARKAGGLFNIYNHGPRERAPKGDLSEVMGDHKARYQWANYFAVRKAVLDVPCGTGYGANLLTNARHYIGLDIDGESIKHAREFHAGRQRVFHTDDMRELRHVGDGMVDFLVSFEGIEHLETHEDQKEFVDQMHRALRPGGTFVISTPQKDAARGTPWDVNILTWDQLLGLFNDGRWTRLDPFYQTHYGAAQTPKPGVPPKSAEIMILGGTRK